MITARYLNDFTMTPLLEFSNNIMVFRSVKHAITKIQETITKQITITKFQIYHVWCLNIGTLNLFVSCFLVIGLFKVKKPAVSSRLLGLYLGHSLIHSTHTAHATHTTTSWHFRFIFFGLVSNSSFSGDHQSSHRSSILNGITNHFSWINNTCF